MDIFAYADSINWAADYYDMHTGYIYGITKTNDHNTIPVYRDGQLIGYVNRD